MADWIAKSAAAFPVDGSDSRAWSTRAGFERRVPRSPWARPAGAAAAPVVEAVAGEPWVLACLFMAALVAATAKSAGM